MRKGGSGIVYLPVPFPFQPCFTRWSCASNRPIVSVVVVVVAEVARDHQKFKVEVRLPRKIYLTRRPSTTCSKPKCQAHVGGGGRPPLQMSTRFQSSSALLLLTQHHPKRKKNNAGSCF